VTAADLDAALGSAERVLLDSSTLIAFHSPSERAHPLAEHLLGRIASDDDALRGYYSVVSAVELLVRPIRTGQVRFTFMHTFLTQYPHLTVLPVDMTVAAQAATLRATMGIALPDAVVIASGLLAGCEAIVTNDERWKRRGETLFRQFRWLYLEDYC
jgi:predicted nucleic acid-binding protein